MNELIIKGERAKKASAMLSNLSETVKNETLNKIAEYLIKYQDEILEANKIDLKQAENKGISKAMQDRLMLNESRILSMAQGVLQIVSLPDPIGEVLSMWKRPNGLMIGKKRVPLGVIGIIYEARPNVTVDAAALCLKAGNAVILRGGSEAINSNLAIAKIMKNALKDAGIDEGAIELVEDTSRETAVEMMKLNKYIDVLIPRGGAGLISTVVQNSTVPVIETGVGNCHIFVDSDCDINMAIDILINAKTQRPAVCNACESLLVHKDIADKFLPTAISALKEKNVEIRGCSETVKICDNVTLATDEDYYTEFLDYIISVKVVNSIDDAIEHINKYGTKHSEAIITKSYDNSQKFLQQVDAAAVYVNASTRFTDGFEFGFGAEIGISTQKIHARGPMGLCELTTIKYIIYGNGQIR